MNIVTLMPNKSSIYHQAALWITQATAILINAGAGMGVDSGLPDFRGTKGFWKAYPPYETKGLNFSDMANPIWFHRDPEFAWGFYGHRLNLYRSTIPHEGFRLLKQWSDSKKFGYFIFTSNVDGQFQKAGFNEALCFEIHGSIHHAQCLNPSCTQAIFPADLICIDVDESTMKAIHPLPVCPTCGMLCRPNILMFGDYDWDHSRCSNQQQKYQSWLKRLAPGDLAVIECGAGTAIPSVRSESLRVAREHQAKVIRINIREPEIPLPHIGIPEGALSALKAIHEFM